MAYAESAPITSAPLPVGTTVPQRRWWRRPWIAPLGVLVIAFVAFSVPPYLSLDPARSRVPLPHDFAAYYPMLVAHVLFASVALLIAPLQVWPWFRERHRTAHRRLGRMYVFLGVIPAGLLGLVIGAFGSFGPMVRVSNVLLALLWLAFTITAYRRARQHRYGEHRRWMIRSVALTLSIITNRIWIVIWILVLSPHLQTTFGGNETLFGWTIAGLSSWMGWVISLLAAQWWIESAG